MMLVVLGVVGIVFSVVGMLVLVLLLFLVDVVGYIVAEAVFSAVPVPPFPASIKDGYAVVGKCSCWSIISKLHLSVASSW